MKTGGHMKQFSGWHVLISHKHRSYFNISFSDFHFPLQLPVSLEGSLTPI
jgi:hypothetical protein